MDIPGFQIERELSRSEYTCVYLASQLNPYRRVVVKTAQCADGEARARLQRMQGHAALQPGFRHPNIVHIQKAGAQDAFLYLVMEYLEGGTLEQNLSWGLTLDKLLRVACDLCDALDHGHAQGAVHGGVRPTNILFRSEAEAVLTEFCPLARFAEGQAVRDVRQQGFMSPEQEAGNPLTPRSDLFSLSAVLYYALTGEAVRGPGAHLGPRGDLLAFAAKLPDHLKALQPVLDKALATEPDRRFQSGDALRKALEAAQQTGTLNRLAVKTAAVSEQEIQRMEQGPPSFAPRDAVRSELKSRRRPSPWRRWALAATAVAALAAGAGYWVLQPPPWLPDVLAQFGLTEDPAMQRAWLEAQALHEDPDQGLAAIVAAHRRVLAAEPDFAPALEALAGLADQWHQKVLAAAQQSDLDGAAARLAEMQLAFADDERLADLERQLINRRAADTLLATSQALLRSQGRSQIPAATVAIQTYQEVLRLAPGHPGALAELAALAEHYAGLAQQAIEQGEVDEAIIYLERAATANAQLPVLAAVREQIQQATTTLATIDELLQQAGALRAQGFLVHPPGQNAAQLYNRVLAIAPDNGIAQQGLNEVTAQLLTDAGRLFEAGDLPGVEALLDQASAAGIGANALNEIKASLDRQVLALAAISEKLEQAQAFLQQGFITEPQEGNAVSVLREIQRLDPNNATAGEMLAEAAARLAEVAQEAFAVGLRDDARHYLDLALTVTPDQADWRTLRQSWQEAEAGEAVSPQQEE